MRAAAAACARLDPDLVLVYMGNNEFLGPFAGTGVPPPAWLAAWLIQLRETRLSQWLTRAAPGEAFGMNLNDPSRVMGRRPGDPFVDRVCTNFESNLEAICRVARRGGADVLLSTVAVNLRDWPPEQSMHCTSLSDEALAEWEEHSQRGKAAQARGAYEEAVSAYRAALDIDDLYAETHFFLAECLSELGAYTEAKAHYEQAAILDGYKYARCKPFLNDVIRHAAGRLRERDVHLVDAAAELDAASEGGVCGVGFIPDSCHPNFEGHYRLARGFAERIREILRAQRTFAETPSLTLEEQGLLLGRHTTGYVEVLDNLLATDFIQSAVLRRRIEEARDRLLTEEPPPDRADRASALEAAIERLGPCEILVLDLIPLLGFKKEEKALPYAEEVAGRYPYWPATHVALGEALLDAERADEAYRIARAALSLFPNHPGVWAVLADAGCACGRAGEVAPALRAHLATHSGDTELWNRLSQCLEAEGRLAEALDASRQGAARVEERAEGHEDPIGLARLLVRQGDMLVALGEIETARDTYRDAIDVYPEDYSPYEKLSNTYADVDDLDGFRKEWEQAVAEHPERAQAHYCLGQAYHRSGMLERAIASYNHALELDPFEETTNGPLFQALMQRGGQLAEDGNVHEARARFRDAIELRPHDSVPYESISETYIEADDLDGLRTEWMRAVATHPDRHQVHYSLAQAYERSGMLDDAIASYRRALEIEPSAEGIEKPLFQALVQRGTQRLEEGETYEARGLFRAAIELQPDEYAPYEGLSDSYVQTNDVEGLRTEWMRAAATRPDKPQRPFSLGLAYERLAAFDRAIVSYRQALELDPHSQKIKDCLFGALAQRAEELLEQGNTDVAREHLRKAIELRPSDYAPYETLSDSYLEADDLGGLCTEWTCAAATYPDRA
ncbi:MAG TPA: tetratricopeptide repeat protein, partial [Candidatus Hydrogenedentes bacterium]|nr:tetratricopeptide repeat protein [Candidatus Hydrogenedentota bacterium]